MSTPTAPSPLHALTERVEQLDALDDAGKAIGKAARGAVGPGMVKDAVSGTWMGHPLHPLLTDVVIGSFTSATVLDLVGGRDSDGAARRLIGVGLLAYLPTALTGMSDWADSEPASDEIRRVGLVHATTNVVAATLYACSLRARRRGRRATGTALALAGAGVLSAGGYLGAHMSFVQGVGVDQTRFDQGPDDWTPVLEAGALAEGDARRAVAGDTPVLLVRQGGVVHALHDRCSHRGCPLSDGEIGDGVVTCGCHGSRFSLDDGSVLRGPATVAQPVLETREADGRIEVRLGA